MKERARWFQKVLFEAIQKDVKTEMFFERIFQFFLNTNELLTRQILVELKLGYL